MMALLFILGGVRHPRHKDACKRSARGTMACDIHERTQRGVHNVFVVRGPACKHCTQEKPGRFGRPRNSTGTQNARMTTEEKGKESKRVKG